MMNNTAEILWNDYDKARPIDDLIAWQTKLAFETGYYPELLEIGVDIANHVMRCKNKYDLKLISELPDLLFGKEPRMILDTASSEGYVVLKLGNFNNKFIKCKVI